MIAISSGCSAVGTEVTGTVPPSPVSAGPVPSGFLRCRYPVVERSWPVDEVWEGFSSGDPVGVDPSWGEELGEPVADPHAPSGMMQQAMVYPTLCRPPDYADVVADSLAG